MAQQADPRANPKDNREREEAQRRRDQEDKKGGPLTDAERNRGKNGVEEARKLLKGK